MDSARKARIKEVMVDVLKKNVGYPNSTPDQIVSQLKNMWVELENQHLTESLSYRDFENRAHNAAMMSKIQDLFKL